MASKGKPKMTDPKIDRQKIKDFMSLVWVLNNLSDTEISKMDTLPFDGERFSEFMELLVDGGMDVKLSWDTYSKSYAISAMGAWVGFPNEGVAISARGVDIFDAWKILWFKIEVIAGWDLKQFVDNVPVSRKRG